MVVEAVRYEPVSTKNSLVTGKITGNLPIFGAQTDHRPRGKRLCRTTFPRISLQKLTGEKIELTGKRN
jgi:hypothetical protein